MDPIFERENEADYYHHFWGDDTVGYLDDTELADYELTVKDGKLFMQVEVKKVSCLILLHLRLMRQGMEVQSLL
jgi:hypothetical protein